MLTNINAIKICKILYIFARIYDLFYWIPKKYLQYFMILFHMYSTKFSKAANFCAHRCGPWCQTFFNHLVQFSKRDVILILSKTHFSAMSFHHNSLTKNLTFCAKYHSLLPITVFLCLSPFQIKILPQILFLSDLVKTKLNIHVFKWIFFLKSAQADV